MATAIVTGAGGLIGSQSVQHFVEAGYEVVGIENDMRARFFGPSASTAHTTQRLLRSGADISPASVTPAGGFPIWSRFGATIRIGRPATTSPKRCARATTAMRSYG